MICDISFSEHYNKECVQSSEGCIWWTKDGCRLPSKNEK